jgi:CDP-glucose 4,6-dehydratase
MANLWHEPVSWSVEKREQPHEAQLLKLDVSKAARRLNWNPSMNLNMALQYTIKWNQDWRNGENMRRVTLCQIESYQISINNMQR